MSNLNPSGPITRGTSGQTLPTPSGEVPMAQVSTGALVLVDGTASPLRINAAGALLTIGSTSGAWGPSSASAAVIATGVVFAAAAGRVITAWTIRETAGAAATCTLHNGITNAGPIIAYISLTANQAIGGDWGGEMINIASGLYLDVTVGAVSFVPMTKTI